MQSILRDGLLLADLQLQLLIADLKQFWAGARVQLVAGMALGCLLVGTLPVLLMGGAHLLAEQLQWSIGAALLLTGASCAVVALLGLLVVSKWLAASAEPLRQSQQELRDNLSWLRDTLRHEDD